MKLKLNGKTMILLAALIICAASGSFYLVYTYVAGDQASGATGKMDPSPEGIPLQFGPTYAAGEFTVNIDTGDGFYSRFLRVGVVLEADSAATIKELTKRDPQVKDAIITLLRSKKKAELTAAGLSEVREEIVTRINAFLPNGRVVRSYFTEFVIQ